MGRALSSWPIRCYRMRREQPLLGTPLPTPIRFALIPASSGFPQLSSRGLPGGAYWPAPRVAAVAAALVLRRTGVMPANGEAADGPPPVRGEGGRRRGGVALHGNDAGPKMAAAGSGGAGGPGSGPRGRWGGCLWVRGVLLVLGGLPAGAGAAPVSLGTSPPCRHHVLSDTEVGRSGARTGRAGVTWRVWRPGWRTAGALQEKALARPAGPAGPAVCPCCLQSS